MVSEYLNTSVSAASVGSLFYNFPVYVMFTPIKWQWNIITLLHYIQNGNVPKNDHIFFFILLKNWNKPKHDETASTSIFTCIHNVRINMRCHFSAVARYTLLQFRFPKKWKQHKKLLYWHLYCNVKCDVCNVDRKNENEIVGPFRA